jgi:hypothetical protein
MARHTGGGVTTDRIASSLAANNDLRSYSIWTYRTGDGGNNLGRIWHKGGSGSLLDTSHNNNSGGTYDYNRRFSVSSGIWTYPRPAANQWHHIVVVHDISSDANTPTIYLDGSIQTLTNTQVASGTRADNNTLVYCVGNRNDSFDRAWDGHVAEFAVWNRLLTQAEAVALSKGMSALAFPSNLVEYLPLHRDSTSRLRAPATITGGSVVDHPPIYYPLGTQVTVQPSVVVPVNSATLFRGRNYMFFDDDEVNRFEFWPAVTGGDTIAPTVVFVFGGR